MGAVFAGAGFVGVRFSTLISLSPSGPGIVWLQHDGLTQLVFEGKRRGNRELPCAADAPVVAHPHEGRQDAEVWGYTGFGF